MTKFTKIVDCQVLWKHVCVNTCNDISRTLHWHDFIFHGICDSIFCGHHVYKGTWSSVLDEELQCHREWTIILIHDTYVVSVVKPGIGVVGHTPRWILTPCNLFIQSGGSIACVVTSSHISTLSLLWFKPFEVFYYCHYKFQL